MPVTKVCENCGNSFNVRPYKQYQRFCSFACRKAKAEEAHAEKTCENCGTKFTVTRKRELTRRFCSKKCTSAYEAIHGRPAAQVTPIEFKCQQCGKPFFYKQAYLTEYRKKYAKDPPYCSRECAAIGRRLSDADWQVNCIQCGKPMPIQRRPGGTVNRQKRLCSTECRSAFRRMAYQTKRPDQQPTKRIAQNGYVRMIIPGKNGEPSRDVFEHRYVMEQKIGRALWPEETVHHVNGIRTDNRVENLELFSSRHGPGQRVSDKVDFAIEILRLYPEFAKDRRVMLIDLQH